MKLTTANMIWMKFLAFVRESVASPLITLDAVAYEAAISSGDAWLIDYFAPWCPPCLRLLPELRKLHRFLEPMVNIGTIDCTIHTAICQRAHVSSYPNTIFHHDGKSHQSVGYHDMGHIVEFITDARNPSVIELSPEDLKEQVLNRETGHIWLVDFFAPWCGPCQQLAPEFRKLARSVKQLTNVVFFGSVDCQTHGTLCSNMHISTYPTVRLFPADNLNHMDYPSNWWRDHGSMQRWLQDFLPSKVSRLGNDFYDRVVSDSEPWLVDFYAPWCGHCVQFAPVFEHIAEVLDGRVHLAKVNCDEWPGVCHSAGVNAYPTLRLYNGSGRSVQGQHIQSQGWEIIVQIVEAELDKSKRLVRDEF